MISFSLYYGPAEDKVQNNLKKLLFLTKNLVHLSQRELSVLAVAVTEMVASGFDPYSERFVVQIVTGHDFICNSFFGLGMVWANCHSSDLTFFFNPKKF